MCSSDLTDPNASNYDPYATIDDGNCVLAIEMHTIPQYYNISSIYPNPFNPTTTIRFSVGGENMGSVHLDIYNITGQLVETLIDEKMTPGEYSILWNGSTAPSGIYFTRLTSGGKTKTMKMILLK